MPLPVPNRLDEGVINIKYNYACFCYYITLVATSTTGVASQYRNLLQAE